MDAYNLKTCWHGLISMELYDWLRMTSEGERKMYKSQTYIQKGTEFVYSNLYPVIIIGTSEIFIGSFAYLICSLSRLFFWQFYCPALLEHNILQFPDYPMNIVLQSIF